MAGRATSFRVESEAWQGMPQAWWKVSEGSVARYATSLVHGLCTGAPQLGMLGVEKSKIDTCIGSLHGSVVTSELAIAMIDCLVTRSLI